MQGTPAPDPRVWFIRPTHRDPEKIHQSQITMQNKVLLHARRAPHWSVAIALLLVSWTFLHLVLHSSSSLFPSSSVPTSIMLGSEPPSSPNPDATPAAHVPESARREGCSVDRAKLKVYMYDMPPAFHFGLLGWEGNGDRTWPDVTRPGDVPRYPGGLNSQHSVEYWLTLDLLSSNSSGASTRPCFAVRVDDSRSADVVFVPFFSSLSYNRDSRTGTNGLLQMELVDFLMGREEWRRSGGKDHVIAAHHPNSMWDARRRLKQAMFVLADFGRCPPGVANVRKDVVAPYKHVVVGAGGASAPFDVRPTLAYFQGAIRRKDGGLIRRKLYHLLKDEKDTHFTFGVAGRAGRKSARQGMASSKFCLSIAGDTPSSSRLFDAITNHCVPVVVSDGIELPFEDVLDYTEFCIFVRPVDAVRKGFLVKFLRGVRREEWTRMWERLRQIAHHFEYQHPSRPGDAVHMIWEAVARKIASASSPSYREKRLNRTRLAVDRQS